MTRDLTKSTLSTRSRWALLSTCGCVLLIMAHCGCNRKPPPSTPVVTGDTVRFASDERLSLEVSSSQTGVLMLAKGVVVAKSKQRYVMHGEVRWDSAKEGDILMLNIESPLPNEKGKVTTFMNSVPTIDTIGGGRVKFTATLDIPPISIPDCQVVVTGLRKGNTNFERLASTKFSLLMP